MMIRAGIREDAPNKITLGDVSPMQKEQVQRIPGVKWDKKAIVWRVPLSWTSYLALQSIFLDQMLIEDTLKLWVENEKSTRIDPSMALRDALDSDGLEFLYPHQRAGVQFLATARRALLCDDMGTGKTIVSIAALMELYKRGENIFPVLVVCPNSTKMGWKREIEKFWPGTVATVVNGSVTQRRKQLKTPSHFYIMNWESVKSHSRLAPYGSIHLKKCVECGGSDEDVTETKCHTHKKELNHMQFGAVIADEAHKMKDAKSQQTRALKAATGDTDVRIAMTGTPISNTPDELWSLLNWISPEEWPSKTKFIDRLLETSWNVQGYETVIGIKKHMKEEFFGGINPRMRRMPKELVLKSLPPVVRERRDVVMSPKQKKAYTQMKGQMIAELDNGDLVITTSPLTKAIRLLQFASSYAEVHDQWDDNEGKVVSKVTLSNPSSKIDAFMADLADFGDSQLVVFAASRQLIELLSDKLTKSNINHGMITGKIDVEERQYYIDRFQEGRLKMILCTTAAGGTGITLTAADTVVFLQRPWSMIDSQQAEARVRRIGSEIHDSISVIDYVTTDTLDEAVIEAVELKTDRLQEILRDKDMFRKAIEENKLGDEEGTDE